VLVGGHHHAQARAGVDVDVREHAALADQQQPRQPLQQRRADLRALADQHQHLGFAQAPGQGIHVLHGVVPDRHVVPRQLAEAGQGAHGVERVVQDSDLHGSLVRLRLQRVPESSTPSGHAAPPPRLDTPAAPGVGSPHDQQGCRRPRHAFDRGAVNGKPVRFRRGPATVISHACPHCHCPARAGWEGGRDAGCQSGYRPATPWMACRFSWSGSTGEETARPPLHPDEQAVRRIAPLRSACLPEAGPVRNPAQGARWRSAFP